ncbi:hypothetical protein WME73_34275 [Sorangium sp. So ce302]|uniref:hypothetical protein n=1 Tax=Sorangium sp. So ce302 TaxID=3133297 RepID=UPI003F5DFAAE
MLELTFKLTPEEGESRDIVVRIHEPTRNPPEKKWPWAVTVDIDGRPSATYGVDPLDAVENGAQHAAIVLRGVHGDALDPPIEPRMKEGQ